MLEMPADNLGTSEHFHGKQVCMYIWRSRIVGQYYATNKQGGHQRWSPVICSRRTCRNYEAVSGARLLLRHWHWELPLVNGRTSHTIFVLRIYGLRRIYNFVFRLLPFAKNGHLSDRCDADWRNWTTNICRTRCQSRDKVACLLRRLNRRINVVIMVLYLKQRDVLKYAIQMTIFSLLSLPYTWFPLKMNCVFLYSSFFQIHVCVLYLYPWIYDERNQSIKFLCTIKKNGLICV